MRVCVFVVSALVTGAYIFIIHIIFISVGMGTAVGGGYCDAVYLRRNTILGNLINAIQHHGTILRVIAMEGAHFVFLEANQL